MASEIELKAMRKALKLACRSRGNTFPNPMVGAVILGPEGIEVGDGFHRKCGTPHAEAVALSSAGNDARGATMVVTLEPCCHQGRTGPCTEQIIEAGISRVVVAMEDPDPRVSGSGAEQLREAGIEVEVGPLAEEARKLNRVYIHFLKTGRSWVTLKMAQSLDGRTAAADGSSRWITCEDSRKLVHARRASVGAVMTGAGTVREDDPELTVRLAPLPPSGQPVRIVVTSTGDLGKSEKLINAPGRTVVALPEGVRTENKRVDIWEFPPVQNDSGFQLLSLLERTAAEGIGEILCEAGPRLSTELLSRELVDSVMIFTAPVLLGGEGRPAFETLGVDSIDDVIRLRNVSFTLSGTDFLTEGDIVHRTD